MGIKSYENEISFSRKARRVRQVVRPHLIVNVDDRFIRYRELIVVFCFNDLFVGVRFRVENEPPFGRIRENKTVSGVIRYRGDFCAEMRAAFGGVDIVLEVILYRGFVFRNPLAAETVRVGFRRPVTDVFQMIEILRHYELQTEARQLRGAVVDC